MLTPPAISLYFFCHVNIFLQSPPTILFFCFSCYFSIFSATSPIRPAISCYLKSSSCYLCLLPMPFSLVSPASAAYSSCYPFLLLLLLFPHLPPATPTFPSRYFPRVPTNISSRSAAYPLSASPALLISRNITFTPRLPYDSIQTTVQCRQTKYF